MILQIVGGFVVCWIVLSLIVNLSYPRHAIEIATAKQKPSRITLHLEVVESVCGTPVLLVHDKDSRQFICQGLTSKEVSDFLAEKFCFSEVPVFITTGEVTMPLLTTPMIAKKP